MIIIIILYLVPYLIFSLYVGILVMFHVTTWCVSCKNIKPKLILAASNLKEKGINCKIASVDCTKETKLAKKLGIKHFPTLMYYRGKFPENLMVKANVIEHENEEQKIVDFVIGEGKYY